MVEKHSPRFRGTIRHKGKDLGFYVVPFVTVVVNIFFVFLGGIPRDRLAETIRNNDRLTPKAGKMNWSKHYIWWF
jgi:hypothetical protein